jgi:UDP-N-acetyl-D-glucosamine dehydrogenase
LAERTQFSSAVAENIASRRSVVAVCGLGYVGLPLAMAVASAGYRVCGFDIDPAKVETLNGGGTYIQSIGSEAIAALRRTGRFEATGEFSRLSEADVVLICVPTPLNRHREPDLSFVERTVETVAKMGRAGQLVVLESTTYPGTTSGLVGPIFERRGYRSGEDIFLAFSPEREDPGNPNYTTRDIPKIVGGDEETALRLACEFYGSVFRRVIPVSSASTAEAVKLTENVFRAVNIALVNELKIIYAAMGIDIWEVIEAAKTKPFGYMPFYPGPGLGGHCIPIDPFYLTWKAREFDIATRFIELAGEINARMPFYVVDRIAAELDARFGRGLKGARVLIIGLAYKKNVDDMRESPALKLMELLNARGSEVAYHDPHLPVVLDNRHYPQWAGLRSITLNAQTVSGFDCVLVATDHDAVDYELLVRHAPLVVDTRNVCQRTGVMAANVARA